VTNASLRGTCARSSSFCTESSWDSSTARDANGPVDYVFTSPGGVTGAVEMTTYRDGRAAALQSNLNEDGEKLGCESLRGWAVTVELGTKLDQLRKRLPSVIAACDRHGVDDPMRLPGSESGADIKWFVCALRESRSESIGVARAVAAQA
jgi:hypothetical protein